MIIQELNPDENDEIQVCKQTNAQEWDAARRQRDYTRRLEFTRLIGQIRFTTPISRGLIACKRKHKPLRHIKLKRRGSLNIVSFFWRVTYVIEYKAFLTNTSVSATQLVKTIKRLK